MKTLKIVSIVGIVIAVGFGAVAIAKGVQQEASKRGFFGWMAKDHDIPKMIMEHMKERLELTDEQEAKILPILKETLEKHQAILQKSREQMEQRGQAAETERQALWQETKKQLEPILTAEQMQELDKMHDEFAEKWQQMRPGFGGMMFRHGKGKGEFPELLKDLNLSDEQRQQLFAIFLKYRDGRRDIVDDFLSTQRDFSKMILTEDFNEEKVRQMFRESTAKFEDFVVSHAKMLAEMKAVLTPEQVELLQKKVPELLDSIQNRIHTGRSLIDPWLQSHNKTDEK
jgi:Spy/CpxP family protein refolding chaperone